MGLFSTRTRTYVSSVVYNLAGDENLRPNLINSAILGHALNGTGELIDTLSRTQLIGSGPRQKRFFRWAQSNYPHALPVAKIEATQVLDVNAVYSGAASIIPLAPNQTLRITNAVIDDADIEYWAEDYVRTNHPTLTLDDWIASYDTSTDKIVITFASLPEESFPAPADLLWSMTTPGRQRLLFLTYSILTEAEENIPFSESAPAMFVYRMGSGNIALDALEVPVADLTEFFPALPLRVDNLSLADSSYSSIYEDVRKAYKKLTGGKLSDLIESIEDNENLGDIDYAFLVQGVLLNTQEEQGKKYIYEFFNLLMDRQNYDRSDLDAYYAQRSGANASASFWDYIVDSRIENDIYNPASTRDMPAVGQTPSARVPENVIKIFSADMPEFDFRIKWNSIRKTIHMGNAKSFDGDSSRGELARGKYWFHVADDLVFQEVIAESERGTTWYRTEDRTYSRLLLFYQHARFSYTCLEIVGLRHKNFVYGTHAVVISGKDALEDEEESGFLLPLHYPTLSKFGLVKLNQLSTTTSHIVFNSYTTVRIRWYQRGIFRLIISIGIAVLAAWSGGASLGSAAGLLGTNASVGAALGIMSPMAAAIAGAIVNGVTAAIVTQAISRASTKIFGARLGAVIGTIASFVAMTYGNHHALHGNWNVDWATVMRADNLLQLTTAVSEAYVGWLNADTMEIFGRIDDMADEYADHLKDIQEQYADVLGITNIEIDPLMFTDAAMDFGEGSESFLSRTLLTGSDIAELTFNMIESFTDVNLSLETSIR